MKIQSLLFFILIAGSYPESVLAEECRFIRPAISVKTDFPDPIVDRSLTSLELSQGVGSRHANEVVRGLTISNSVVRREAALLIETNNPATQWCANLQTVTVTLSFTEPVRVYVASDIVPGSCEDSATLQHEQEHVTFAYEAQKRMAQDISANLEARLVSQFPVRAVSEDGIREEVDSTLAHDITDIIRPAQEEQALKNAGIDTPENYQRIARSCP